MSHPNTPPPEDPYGQNPYQGGQDPYGQNPQHGGQDPYGQNPQHGGQDPYGQNPQQGGQGYPSGGYPSPSGGQPGYQGPSGGQPGYQGPSGGQPGYPPQGGYQEQTGGYQAPGHQPGYGATPHGGHGGPSSATTGQPNPDEKQMGMFAHLGGMLGFLLTCGYLGVVAPLIIFLVKKDESPYVRDQSTQALNFQIILLIGIVAASFFSFFLGIFLPFIVFIAWLLWFALWVGGLVFGILGTVAANKGEWYRYPFNVSWIK
ncbi:DUF4870 domain-containing protein [Nocardiopsis sp. N85]|uniref:DUF4870 domain-containing protein n=1 Tax=Nocardiopsis sp. N85 TaxID=3029400 RepID=UPI00237F771F|nr:DUF4870 domain-containing protein [Nocardiopsis sp. N85]MDE3720067.1 DUF4870 domain-containing protein [Nocardiopsis sp. N85]